MSDAPFTLAPSPADPEPVRVFQIGNAMWWAGYSLQQCIDAAHAEDKEHGCDTMDYNVESYQLSDQEIQALTFFDCCDEPDSPKRTFAAELQRRIDAGERFPQLFACTEY